jgi:hypothetical protein
VLVGVAAVLLQRRLLPLQLGLHAEHLCQWASALPASGASPPQHLCTCSSWIAAIVVHQHSFSFYYASLSNTVLSTTSLFSKEKSYRSVRDYVDGNA